MIEDGAGLDIAPAHLVGTGGAVGAICRHWVYERLENDAFPVATLAVNAVGSFVLALAVFLEVGSSATALVGIGACGSFTTFSSFSVETVGLWDGGERRRAVANAAANLACSLAGVALAGIFVAALG